MQISNSISLHTPQTDLTSATQNTSQVFAAANDSTATASGPAAHASISSQSALIRQATGVDSDVRMDKVQSLQTAIASGNYHVDSGAVADKIISSLLAK